MTVRDEVEETEETQETEHEEEEEHEEVEEEEDDTGALVDALADRMGTRMESIVDRRVNSLMKTLQNDYGLQKAAPESKPAGDGMNPAFGRQMLKLSIKEELQFADFGSKEEAKAARDLALELGDKIQIDDLDDVDSVASEIVSQVEKTMTSMKETYQKQLRSDLKKRGLLRDEDESDKSPNRNSPGDDHAGTRQWDKGAERARKMFDTQQKEA